MTTTANPDTNHRAAIGYRYADVTAEERAPFEHAPTAEVIAAAEQSFRPDTYRATWAACAVLADRSQRAHDFEREYGEELEARYNAVCAANPDADPHEAGGEFDAAYGAYADAHPVLVPSERAMEWARGHMLVTEAGE